MGEEGITELINNLRADLTKQIETVNKNINQILNPFIQENEKLKAKINDQEKRLENIEREQRKRNVVIHGIKTPQGIKYFDLERIVLKFINQKLQVEIDENAIDSVYKINANKEDGPIVVSLISYRIKIIILKNRSQLKNTQYYIDEDYPIHVLKQRKELIPKMKEARSQGKYAVIKYNKLIIESNVREDGKKRNRSEEEEIQYVEEDNPSNTINNKGEVIKKKPTYYQSVLSIPKGRNVRTLTRERQNSNDGNKAGNSQNK